MGSSLWRPTAGRQAELTRNLFKNNHYNSVWLWKRHRNDRFSIRNERTVPRPSDGIERTGKPSALMRLTAPSAAAFSPCGIRTDRPSQYRSVDYWFIKHDGAGDIPLTSLWIYSNLAWPRPASHTETTSVFIWVRVYQDTVLTKAAGHEPALIWRLSSVRFRPSVCCASKQTPCELREVFF